MDGPKLCLEANVEEERGTQCICEKKSRAIVTRLEYKFEPSKLVLCDKIAIFDFSTNFYGVVFQNLHEILH